MVNNLYMTVRYFMKLIDFLTLTPDPSPEGRGKKKLKYFVISPSHLLERVME